MGCIPSNNCIPPSYFPHVSRPCLEWTAVANTSDVHIVTTNSRVLHATDTHVHPSQTGHISCERSPAGPHTRLERLQVTAAEKEDE